jgi:HAD superfamily hydrolase (TIGR01509 family)
MTRPAAVIFDLDGVLVDSESAWNGARREVAEDSGGAWHPGAQEAMMGMSSREWSRYMRGQLGVRLREQEISDAVVERLGRLYRDRVPVLPGAREAVSALASRWPLGLASSANRTIIELVLELAGLSAHFKAVVSSEEVAGGKPAPDVYLEAARRIECEPTRCAAVEDSANGIRAAGAAGMKIVAIPNREFPPPPEVLATADAVLPSIQDLEPAVIEALDEQRA